MTENPRRARRSNHRQENDAERKSFCQNAKKMNESAKGQNAKISETIKSHEKEIGNNLAITRKTGDNRLKSKASSQLCNSKTVKDGRKCPNKRVALIREHLERINDHIERANGHEENTEEHALNNDGHAPCEGEHDTASNNEQTFVHVDVYSPNVTREYRDTARGKDVIERRQNNDQKPSQEKQQPLASVRKIRKMWTKDILANFPIAQDDKSGALNTTNNGQKAAPRKTSDIQQPKERVKIVRERIHISGGVQKNDYFAHKALTEYDPETGAFITRGAMCTGRYNHGIAQLGEEIYQVGGNSGFFEQLRSVESYSPKHEQWTSKPSMGEARDEFSLAVCDGCLYAIGGHNGIQDMRSVEKFNARENVWSFVSPMRNYRAGACACAVDDR